MRFRPIAGVIGEEISHRLRGRFSYNNSLLLDCNVHMDIMHHSKTRSNNTINPLDNSHAHRLKLHKDYKIVRVRKK